ncbi:sugar 3,4-ketoisomerase [Eubacterium sp. MSJ-33]|uniref:sugar 3,4-ketoisomerase n=1 Tax=Eubacterium sp. MSJ-33 TaxID=2841528 RepID=UPI00351D32A4
MQKNATGRDSGEKMKKDEVTMLEFPQRGDERGHLVVVEGMQDVPFEIKRIFYIYGSDLDVVRGQHANRKTQFVLINVSGKSKVKVLDGKGNEAVFSLNRPHTGIYLPSMVWKEMYDFSEDSVLLCLASEHYDAAEYIRNYDEYVKEVNG